MKKVYLESFSLPLSSYRYLVQVYISYRKIYFIYKIKYFLLIYILVLFYLGKLLIKIKHIFMYLYLNIIY